MNCRWNNRKAISKGAEVMSVAVDVRSTPESDGAV
jgi:uncharacterized alpha/beta hydrolase family protein